MAKKKPSVLEKAGEIFKEEKELTGELFDINAGKGLVRIKIDRIVPNPNQPRKTFYEQTISELAESIKEHGILSPIIVRPSGKKYEIVAGERRFKASRQAGLKEIPALIRKVSNGEARVISLIENIQREDLNDIDRASALRDLKVNLGSPWEAIAKRLGLTKRRVLDLVGLLDLPEEVKEEIRHKKLTEKHGRALRQLLKEADILREVFEFFQENKLTGDQSLELVKAVKSEPGFTIKEIFNKLDRKPKKEKSKQSTIEIAINDCAKLSRTIEKLGAEKITKDDKKEIKKSLQNIKAQIDNILDFIKG